jgi:hypothetical protein
MHCTTMTEIKTSSGVQHGKTASSGVADINALQPKQRSGATKQALKQEIHRLTAPTEIISLPYLFDKKYLATPIIPLTKIIVAVQSNKVYLPQYTPADCFGFVTPQLNAIR